ncbi:hypothetical protein EXIGLDRAFT_844460 [Exidia glandulosa HHB12029]|uniref:E3 ubiquitin protein ligase n=1 Tax=Exidia glandulosa HHB12029 TaxID=1314781 RepID=A0A165C102_EXIGL|nr:hypothetical protein EXIGLDRAFT_844460 [Exidia glandulosa HHB12029]
MMESRKRPGSPVEDPSAHKKRAIASATDDPTHTNGVEAAADDAELAEDSNLELFRKEAIFRRMRHYAREHERGRRRVEELEAAQETYLAGMQAIETCWNQLVAEIRALVSVDDIPKSSLRSNAVKLPKLASDIPAYESAVEERRVATRTLVNAFVARAGTAPDNDALQAARREAQSEASRLHSENKLLEAKLESADEQLDKLRNDLAAAEMRVDRIKRERDLSRAPTHPPPTEPGSERVPNESRDASMKPEASKPPEAVNGHKEEESLDEVAVERAKAEKFKRVAEEQAGEIARLKAKVAAQPEDPQTSWLASRTPSEHDITNSEQYKALELELKKANDTVASLKLRLEEVEQAQTKFENEIKEVTTGHANALKGEIAKQMEEIMRLRGERDATHAELQERKQVSALRFAALGEFKTLAAAREDRIQALQSEVKRLKTRAAASEGDEDLYTFLRVNGENTDASYVDDLKNRLQAAEDKAKALQAAIDARSEDAIGGFELEARELYEGAKRRLERYDTVFGPDAVDASGNADLQQLASLLEAKEKSLAEQQLLRQQEAEALDSCYSEIDRLSTSWETLDTQMKSKVFDLAALEKQIADVTASKIRKEMMFYSADNKIKNLESTIKLHEANSSKQLNALHALHAKHSEEQKVFDNERTALATLKKEKDACEEKITGLRKELREANEEKARLQRDLEQEKARVASLTHDYSIRSRNYNALKSEHEGEKEKVAQLKQQLEQRKKFAAVSANESDLQDLYQKSMGALKCSTCKKGFREQLLQKCGHTFCKECVDSRISTRQRKCPACNLPFAQSEVITLFLQ